MKVLSYILIILETWVDIAPQYGFSMAAYGRGCVKTQNQLAITVLSRFALTNRPARQTRTPSFVMPTFEVSRDKA